MTKPASASPRRARTRIAPRHAAAESKLNRHWRGVFLAALAETSNVTASAAAAGVHPTRPYKVRRAEPAFASQWFDALCEGYDNLEMEVLNRLRFGSPKSDDDPRHDNNAAIRQLALHRETVTRQRAQRDHEDAVVVRAAIDAKLAQLRAQIAARRAAGKRKDAGHGAG